MKENLGVDITNVWLAYFQTLVSAGVPFDFAAYAFYREQAVEILWFIHREVDDLIGTLREEIERGCEIPESA